MSVTPENGLCNYSTSTAIFTHLKVRINHHSYSFLMTREKFWFSVWSRAFADQLNDARVKAQALVPLFCATAALELRACRCWHHWQNKGDKG